MQMVSKKIMYHAKRLLFLFIFIFQFISVIFARTLRATTIPNKILSILILNVNKYPPANAVN